jgi:hypothetical protein
MRVTWDENIDHGRLIPHQAAKKHGAGLSMPKLRRVIAADCPRMQADKMHDVCGVHFPQLPGLF